MSTFSTSPEISNIVAALAQQLETLPVNGVLPYQDIINHVPRYPSPYAMTRAIRKAEQSCGSLFERVRGVGIKRLDTNDAIHTGTFALRKAQRSTRRAIQRLDDIKANFTESEERTFIAIRSQLGAVTMLSNPTSTKKILHNQPDVGPLPVGDVFNLFK